MTAGSVTTPLLMMQGASDEIIPVEGASHLSDSAITSFGRDINYIKFEGPAHGHNRENVFPKAGA